MKSSLIPIISSFFENRIMQVKWHGCLSSERLMPAGGPQGSSLGVLGYISQSNDNSDCVPIDDRYKYMDDLTMLEAVYLTSIGIATYNLKNHVPSNIPIHNQIISSDQLKTKDYLDQIETWTEKKKMVLNEKFKEVSVFHRFKIKK